MGLLDILRGAVPAAAAARTGFLTGEKQEQDENKKENLQAVALIHQSRLDQLRAQHDAAQADADTARADYYRHRIASPAATAPHTLQTDEGIMQWDAATSKWKRTGFAPPEKASDRAAGRMEKREGRVERQQALQGVQHQISETRNDLRDAPNDVTLDDKQVTSRVGQLRQRLDSLGHVSDSLNAEIKLPGSGAAAGRAKSTGAVSLTPAAGGSAAAADSDYARAADAYQQALKEGTDPATARSLYDRAVARLAKKHGQMK